MKVACCWCGGSFVKIGDHYWCETPECRVKQAEHAILVQDRDSDAQKFLYVPLPKQAMFDGCKSRYLLGGGAAGSTKSHAARWGLYRRALAIPDYEGLLLRRTWPELEKHHFRLMEREARVFQSYGIHVTFSPTNREMKFHDNGSVIEGGHMENPDDVDRYLSRERDEIVCDEGSTFPPRALLELSTRARTTKPQVLATGSRGSFRVYTNPGGPSSSALREFFIDHEPDWDQYPPFLKVAYRPEEWVYIPGNLEDNPYLSPDYERDLALLTPWRFQQLRHNDWNVIAGQFFTEFYSSVHVKDLGIQNIGEKCEFFRSLDWGYISPGCILWWACLPDGIYYIVGEMKFSHATIPTLCDKILERDDTLDAQIIRYTAADPSLWSPGGITGGTFQGEDMNETFSRNGVPLVKADNDRHNGWQRVRELLQVRDDGKTTIIIHPDCKYLIRTFANAISAKNDPEDVDTTIDDHAIDALRYGAMSRPAPTRRKSRTRGNTFNAARERLRKHQLALTRR